MDNDVKQRKKHKKKHHKDIRYDEEPKVTKHGYKRVRERLGIPKNAVQKNAERALKYGVPRQEVSGPLRRYLDALYYEYGTADNLRIYNRHLYIFCSGDVLVTVLNIPYKYIDAADIAQRRRKKELGDIYAKN